MIEHTQIIEIDARQDIQAVRFIENDKRLMGGGQEGTRAWGVEDAKEVPAPMQTKSVECIAVSNDGKWIAVGTTFPLGNVFLWDGKTGEQILKYTEAILGTVHAIDFSPDSTHFVVGSDSLIAAVWCIATRKPVHTLRHGWFGFVFIKAVKYSSEGDHIATATFDRVRVWDSQNATLLLNIEISVVPWRNTSLAWFNNHLFVVSDGNITELDASTGLTVSQWSVEKSSNQACIALPKHEGFVAYSTERVVTFWDTSMHAQLGLIEHSEEIRSVTFSSDGRLLAIGGKNGKISIHLLHHTPKEPVVAPSPALQESASTRYTPPAPGLREWAKVTLANRPWKDALRTAATSTIPKFTVYQVLCEHLESDNHITDALGCFEQMTNELGGSQLPWAYDCRQRLCKKLEHLGDMAVGGRQHHEAISHLSTALSLQPSSPQDILIKRSKAYTAIGSWKQALDDANEAITLDPSLPWGYEVKHAALHKSGDYDSAIAAFEVMMSKMQQSPDPDIQRRGDKYVSPSSTRAEIRKVVHKTVRRLPRVLINMTDGRLYDRGQHASAFEELPIFNELVSSTTKRTDYVRIKREVRQYFRYVMLSHRWEEDESLYEDVVKTTVYALEQTSTHDKLQMFCRVVRDSGFIWAWSDTCCINKSDHFVLQEALVAMFKWYEGSALTIVYLRGVRSLSEFGALMKSTWNTRGWTLQEYIAAKVVHFYTEEWTPYLNLQSWNHKLSREVILEMEEVTGVSTQQLRALRPGLSNIREKLRLASVRQTTLVEDAAYSLLGIFSVAGLPAIYGEGEGSLGRLLAHVLAGSGDVSVLAWTGESGPFNSCLPAYITVFKGPATSHLPLPIPDAEMEESIATLHTSSFDLEVALKLYDHLNKLPAPWLAASRMKLPCIAFQLPAFSHHETPSGVVYRANTAEFGTLEIRTRYDLSRMRSLYLVHPWLDTILEQDAVWSGKFVQDGVTLPPPLDTDDEEMHDEEIDPSSLLEPEPSPFTVPSRSAVPMERETHARRLAVRLKQPFGALLLVVTSMSGRTVDHRRVAADCLITVQFRDDVSLTHILDNVRTLDVL